MSAHTQKLWPLSNQPDTASGKNTSERPPLTTEPPQLEITSSHRNLLLQKLALHSVHVTALINTLRDPDKYVTLKQVEYVLTSLSVTLDEALNPRPIVD